VRREDFAPPLGNIQSPYSDFEQGWEIAIAEYDHFVYVLEGNFDRINVEGYHSWFKVTEETYLRQWRRGMQLCRELISFPCGE
jgi:hypothetical protein